MGSAFRYVGVVGDVAAEDGLVDFAHPSAVEHRKALADAFAELESPYIAERFGIDSTGDGVAVPGMEMALAALAVVVAVIDAAVVAAVVVAVVVAAATAQGPDSAAGIAELHRRKRERDSSPQDSY